MEKEKVLEIEFQKVWDNKWAWKIIKNEIDFKNTGVEIVLHHIKINCANKEKLYLFDNWLAEWELIDSYTLIDLDLKIDIQNFVNYINEKYGIPKRWKPKLEESFFIVERVRTEVSFKWVVTDLVYKNDHWIDFYAINSGNCFKTYEEAEKVVLKLEESEKNFWAKVRAGEIGGENNDKS